MLKGLQFDNPLMNTFSWIGDMIVLNLLFLLTSLPIITMGAAMAAAYDTIHRLRKDEGESVPKLFWRGLRSNFRQSTWIWLIYLAIGALLAVDVLFLLDGTAQVSLLWYVLPVIGAIVYLFSLSFVFPLTALFENTVFKTIKNALQLAFLHPLTSLAMGVLLCLPLILFLCGPIVFIGASIIWLSLGFAVTFWVIDSLAEKCIVRYAPEIMEKTENID